MMNDKRKIKIVRIFSRLNIGGPSLQVVLLSEHLFPQYETILVTGDVGKEEGDMSYLLQNSKKYRHVFIPELGRNIHFWKDGVAFYKILKLLIHERPTIVHTHTAKAGVLGRLAAMVARAPIRIHTFHGHVFNGYFHPLKTRLIIGIERILAYFTTTIIAISPRQKDDLVNTYRITSEKKVSVIPLGFDLSPFREPSKDILSVKQHFQLPLDKYLIGVVGRLVPIKNHIFFLMIAKKILQRRKDIHFIIVGEGEHYEFIRNKIYSMGISDYFSLLGWQKELKPVYDVLDIVCLTSLNEGTPVSLIEAQACEKAIVATDVGGVRDIVFPGENGYAIPLDHESDFVEKIIVLLDDIEIRQKMGKCGKKFVFENFAKEKLLENIDKLYSNLIKANR